MIPNITVSDMTDLHIVRAALTMYADVQISRVQFNNGPVQLTDLLAMVEITERVCALLETLTADVRDRIPGRNNTVKEHTNNGS